MYTGCLIHDRTAVVGFRRQIQIVHFITCTER